MAEEELTPTEEVHDLSELQQAKAGIFDCIDPDPDPHIIRRVMNYFRKGKNAETYKDVPDFMLRDIFKMYFTHQDDMRINIHEDNDWWFDTLQMMDNYLMKIVTEEKQDYSFIVTKHLAKFLAKKIQEDPDFTKKMQQGGGSGENDPNQQDGDGQGNGKGQGQKQQKQQQQFQKQLQDGVKQALNDAKDEIEQHQNMEEGAGGDGASKESVMGDNLSFDQLEERMNILGKISISRSSIGKLITKSIKSFKQGFSSKTKVFEEDLVDAEDIDEIPEAYKLLHRALISDISVDAHCPINTSFDVYVDCSGSMSSTARFSGQTIERMNLAVALTARLKALGMLNDVYKFEGDVKKVDSFQKVFGFRPNGGTNIERVMENIVKTKNPSVIITDAEDRFRTYTDNAFMMVITNQGSEYYQTQPEVAKMIKNKRFLVFEDNRLYVPKAK